jgi:B-box zinc finger protein
MKNPELALKRCGNHGQREAVARCPECGRFFCRECVTEHEDRLLCANCLRKQVRAAKATSGRFGYLIRAIQIFAGILLLWIFFYYLGQALLLLPDEFHEGTLWKQKS